MAEINGGSQAADQHNIAERKAQHLDICIDQNKYQVESGSTRLNEVHFIHNALPELDVNQIDTSTEFLGNRMSLPFFISSMTGGSEHGFRINKELALAAQAEKIGVGMGSIRILLRQPEVFEHFTLRKLAPDVPIFANLGAVQIRDLPSKDIHELLRKLEVSALAIHVNPGQELFQTGGDRNFVGVIEAIKRFIQGSPVPVIIKETGFGIHPGLIRQLLDAGAAFVNLAGSGGTNWISVESYRDDPAMFNAAQEFRGWGIPTGLLLASTEASDRQRLLASGGLRSGLDIAKTVAMGAAAAGFALPFIRAVHAEGQEGVQKTIQQVRTVFTACMALTGSNSLEQFRQNKVWYESVFQQDIKEFSRSIHGNPGTA